MSEQCKRTNERTSEWPSTYIAIYGRRRGGRGERGGKEALDGMEVAKKEDKREDDGG